MLATLIEQSQRNWDEILPYVLYAYRTAIHSATGETLFYLMFGRDALTPTDIQIRPKFNPDLAGPIPKSLDDCVASYRR